MIKLVCLRMFASLPAPGDAFSEVWKIGLGGGLHWQEAAMSEAVCDWSRR